MWGGGGHLACGGALGGSLTSGGLCGGLTCGGALLGVLAPAELEEAEGVEGGGTGMGRGVSEG